MKKIRVLDLFSGIGGFSLGLGRTGGFETVAFCEIEEYPRKVLAKHWPDVPCHKDVKTLTKDDIDGPIDLICGGYPCQPFSVAGNRKGAEDDRHLWPEVSRLLDELRPAWFIGENVTGHISMGLDDVLSDLEAQGYASRTFVIPACAVDAKHRRDRVWIVAHDEIGINRTHNAKSQKRQKQEFRKGNCSEIVAHTNHTRLQRGQETGNIEIIRAGCDKQPKRCTDGESWNAWPIEPDVGRVAHGVPQKLDGDLDVEKEHHEAMAWTQEPKDTARVATGIPNRVNRLKGLGNAVVPQIPEIIGYAIIEAERNKKL